MLDNYLPFLIYAAFAAVIPASMILMSFVFAQRTGRKPKARMIPFESGVQARPHASASRSASTTAMLFIVFDIEIVFYPLALVLEAR